MQEMKKTYNPKEIEDNIYQIWEDSGFFNPDKLIDAHDRFWEAENFSLMMPPPNATGELHMGHALMLALEDIMIRYARMSGKKTLWLPGTDHAAIATQNVVERQLWETEKKTRHDIGREELLQRIKKFVEQTRGRIQMQIRKLGSSTDWSRERYTLSPELSLAVRTVFKKMYDQGLIYRGDRIVNWCPRCGTTLADDEVEHETVPGKMYYIRYPLTGEKGHLIVATARPETMLADTALAVNPEDQRYRKYVGKSAMLPILNRELPVIADEYVDPAYGTGVMKVTPGHDLNDFELGQKHNLAIINLFTPEGKISKSEAYDHGFEEYADLTTQQAREQMVRNLTEQEFLEKVEDLEHSVGLCYRCSTTVEPIVSKQWFVNVEEQWEVKNAEFQKLLGLGKTASLKELAISAVKTGAIKVIPERFTNVYLHWMENLRDWNISRQIWYGHQIPVWYCGNCHETIVEIETPKLCPKCNQNSMVQDPDTLDTWFSSSLWTFSTLGWPEDTADLQAYHPTTILETGYDILFFWVARMILMTGFTLNAVPFYTIYLHGLVRDPKGQKMSKSKGNVQNPLDVIDEYGTDALRLALVIGTTPGNDTRISRQKLLGYRNFINKLWNIARFVLQKSSPALSPEIPITKSLNLVDQWILSELENLISEIHNHFENQQYGLAGERLYDFTWNKFADWYVEISKIQSEKSKSKEILPFVLQTLLKLWHPFIPFVTEKIWSNVSESLLMISPYPTVQTKKRSLLSTGSVQQFQSLQTLVVGLRNLRAEYRQAPGRVLACYLELGTHQIWLKDQISIIEKLARVRFNFEKFPADKKMPLVLWEGQSAHLVIPHFDPKTEKTLAQKKLQELEFRMEKLGAQYRQKDFLKKAPAVVVKKIKTEIAQLHQLIDQVKNKIQNL